MKKLILGVLVIAVMLFSSMSCNNVESETVNSDIKFTWTAPGDDANIGLASLYLMKYSANLDSLTNNFDDLTSVIAGMPVPGNPLTLDSIIFNMDITKKNNKPKFEFQIIPV